MSFLFSPGARTLAMPRRTENYNLAELAILWLNSAYPGGFGERRCEM
jgi:hypothetical protein